MTPAGPSVRDKLLRAAATLFHRDGVAKQSRRNNFGSKADLANADLQARHEERLGLYARRAADARTAAARVLALFEACADHAESACERGFRECGRLNAAAELAADDPGRRVVRARRQAVEDICVVGAKALAAAVVEAR